MIAKKVLFAKKYGKLTYFYYTGLNNEIIYTTKKEMHENYQHIITHINTKISIQSKRKKYR